VVAEEVLAIDQTLDARSWDWIVGSVVLLAERCAWWPRFIATAELHG
jgi:hypothetical protein